MKIASFVVARPIFTTMMTLIVISIGAFAVTRLPIDLMPEVTNPVLTVSTSYSNASPQEMETLITQYIEEAVAAVPGVKQLTSESGEGVSNVRVEFTWGTDLDVASNDIRDRIDRTLDNLPEDADRPLLRKFDVAAFPIVILGVSSDLDPLEVRKIIDDRIQYRLERTPGVASVDVWGGLEREVQVNVDLDKLRALDIPLEQIRTRLRESNINLPAGTIERGNVDVTLRTPGEYVDIDEIASTVVATRQGTPVYLRNIAEVKDTHRKLTRIVRINGKPGVRLAVRKQSGTNTVAVADSVLEEVQNLNRDFPQMDIIPVIDTSQYIRRSIRNVRDSVMYGGILAILVLFFFLRSLRSTLVIGIAIPISIIASFALIYFAGYTLNLMTLGGLALGVGMMVDNSIVVLENIYRVREEKPDPREAAVQGTDEVTAAIIASTLTTLVIFLPLLFIQGVTGELFGQLAVVIAFALLCSLGVAIALVPMLASRFLRAGDGGHATKDSNWIARHTERFWNVFEETYRDLLELSLRVRFLVILFVIAAFAGCFMLLPHIGAEFLPASDEGQVDVSVEMAVGTRLDVLDRKMREVEAICAANVPETKNTVVNMGASSFRPGSAATGSVSIAVGPVSTRQRTSEQIANDLRKKLGGVAAAEVRVRPSQGLRVLRMGQSNNSSIDIEIYGYDYDVLDDLAVRVKDAIEDVPGVTEVETSREAGVPQEVARIQRDRAADLGLSISAIANALETAVAGNRGGNFREGGDEYPITVKLLNAERLSTDQILDLVVNNDRGDSVALRNVLTFEPLRGPQVIERKNQERYATVSADITGRDLGSVAADIQEKLRSIPRPNTYEMVVAGEYKDQQEAFHDLIASLILSLVLVFMVLASLYESLLDPIIVMFSVPLAAIGVLLMLFLTNTTFNTQSFIGCIMLGGIVVNNAILIVDQATGLCHEGWRTYDAVVEAGRRRLRPILMTSLTTILGLVPLAMGWGEGAEQQAPLARAVIGGMLSSTLITLFFIPAIYLLFHRAHRAPQAAKEVGASALATIPPGA